MTNQKREKATEEVVAQEEQEKEPITLWDMFMDYVKDKDKRERKQFIETV